ncbi:acyl-CoA dehydrogenase type 2 domain-containing protein [Streptomyces albus]|uniref:Acyl-CoA dehydrogenase type 2 domain-containing protein n=1 Tax=Streptomyces albus (strain ATCC 21838 / DSM 41398 / FERM P-419 / JCM 4703 / NBRC 107858) TaxID=1081613 RepID=A0A0B5ELX6_STRA4|nr:acyl-CoA dehydrogenase type 2 domain-containing protein [Streptomyces albus]AOU76898.1 acyl-CoA dehydrogenase type 2 domain-containing protein [Streptomyces albus]AYN32676.1 acyl-CoA dehydrogenase [Streptomyces albus]
MAPALQDSPGLLRTVREVVPLLREHGRAAEEQGRIPRESLRALERAGVFRMAVPERFGGLGLPLAEQARVVGEIARGCPASGWNLTGWLTGTVMAGLYPDAVQEEVFAGGSVRVSVGFAPTGTVRETAGGRLLSGRWNYNSGVHAADWDCLAAVRPGPDGTEEEFFVLVPTRELSLVEDWDVSAARGTGSVTAVAEDVFVPAERIASYEEVTLGTTGGRWNAGTAGRNYGVVAFVMGLYASMALGLARGAQELFLERLPGRGITYTDWEDQRAHPLTQRQVALAANKITAGAALTGEVLALLQRRADAGEQPSTEEKALVRGRAAFAASLAKEAVEVLHSASGASVIKRSVPLQRFHRDMLAFSLHALGQIDTNMEIQGRVLLGLTPGTDIL